MAEEKKTLTLGGLKRNRKNGVTNRKGKTVFVPKKDSYSASQESYVSASESCRRNEPVRIRTRPHKKIESKNKHKIALRKLEKEFPKVFNLAKPRPLTIGIRDNLLKMEKEVSNKTVRLGLFFYCNSHQYLHSVKEGVKRVNENGRFTKPVTKEEEVKAKSELSKLYKSIKNKKS